MDKGCHGYKGTMDIKNTMDIADITADIAQTDTVTKAVTYITGIKGG
jgi:hypothetical protein